MKTLLFVAAVVLMGITFIGSSAPEHSDAWIQQVSERQYFAVTVEDLDSASAWYQQVFDMESVWGIENNERGIRTANFVNDFIHIELVHLPTFNRNEDSFGHFKVGTYVPDVAVIADRVEESTGERPSVVEFEQMNQKILQLTDPEGNRLQFMSMMPD